jgi:DNA-binding response OmpR family regulator
MSTIVLLAAQDASSSILLERRLRAHGFEIAAPGARADVVIAGGGPELERFCAEAPVIVLGAAGDEPDDRVLAFRRGCDDYLAPPFHYEELVERIRAVLRRSQRPAGRVLEAGRLRIDEAARVATLGGVALQLSNMEFRLLAALARDPGRVFTRNELLRDVWEWPASMATRTLDSHASRLRRKLRALDPLTPYVDNEWGIGYRLVGHHPGRLAG